MVRTEGVSEAEEDGAAPPVEINTVEAVLEAVVAGAEFEDPLVVPAAVETVADAGTETPEELVMVVLSPPSVLMNTITEALGTELDFSLEEELEVEVVDEDEDEYEDEDELDEEADDDVLDDEDVLDESEELDELDELSLESTDCPFSNFLISSCAWSYLPLTSPPSALMDFQEPD